MANRDYSITGPDGRTLTINGPEDATPEQLKRAAQKAFGAQPAAPADEPEPSFMAKVGQQVGNAGAGLVRGAGSIGATLLAPIDMAREAIDGKGLSLESNRQRRADMDAALGTMGADTDSLAYKGGKLAGEIAGTAGAGGVVANGLRYAGAAVNGGRAAPGVNALAEAIGTGGFRAGGAGLPTRVAGGAINGAVSAGLANPEDAGMGAAIGGALPVVTKAAGAVGNKLGSVLRGPEQSPDLAAAVNAARGAGYVIPPTQAKASLGNRLLEGFSGKITTAQNASAKNQTVTNGLAAEALGLAKDTKLTPDVLKTVRDQAGTAYQAIGQAGTITPGKTYTAALDAIEAPFKTAAQGFPNAKQSPVLDIVESLRSPSFDSASAVEKIKELRTAADDAFRKGDTDIARASKKAAGALEDAIEAHLKQGIPTSAGPLASSTKPPAEGFTRLYRAESPTVKFQDVFDASGLSQYVRPAGMKGKRYADDINVANYYKRSYGPDAKISFVDVPDEHLGKVKVADGEYIVDQDAIRLPAEGVLQSFRDARTLIAKTYSVEKAMNSTTGSVDARKLAGQLAKGKPLSNELKTAAEFGARFPKAAQSIEGMGSLPQTSPLDWALATGTGIATANPLALAGVVARPAARAAALSPLVQNRLIQSAPGAGVNPNLLQFGYRSAPLIGQDR